MIICIGYEHKAGEFEKDGNKMTYDNIIIEAFTDECGEGFKGIGKGVSFKFKRENFHTIPETPLEDLIGKSIVVSFDVSGNVPKPNKVFLTGEKSRLVWDK